MIVGMWRSTHVIFKMVKKPFVLVKNNLETQYGLENLLLSIVFGPFWVHIMPPYRVQKVLPPTKMIVGMWP